jgi:hypothetical protein
MATMNFDQLWEAAKALTPDEQHRLRNLLDTLLARQGRPLTKEDELDLLLLKEGEMSRAPTPPTSDEVARFQNWKPIEIQGKPLSETIVEERR